MMRRQFIAALLIATLLVANGKADSIPLVDMDPGSDTGNSFDEPNINGTWGWTFFVKSPIAITHVAWYDEGQDGLSHSHRIGLWKDLSGTTEWPYVSSTQAQQLLGSFPPVLTEGVVIPAGVEAELSSGWWRRVPLPGGPMTLNPGGYVLGGLDNANSTDAIRYHLDFKATGGDGNSLPADPRIQIGAPGSSMVMGFSQPTQFFLVGGVELGPMLFVQPVPEPSALALASLAVSWVFFIRSRSTGGVDS